MEILSKVATSVAGRTAVFAGAIGTVVIRSIFFVAVVAVERDIKCS